MNTINIELNELLTTNSCSKLIIELIKFILHDKQQISFTCDTLFELQSRSKPSDKNFNSIRNLLNTIDNINKQLNQKLNIGHLKSIIIIIGATIISPKFSLKIQLPSVILSSEKHCDYHHNYRKTFLFLMRNLIESPEFQKPSDLGPTNIHILIQQNDANSKSEYFLPKPQFSPSSSSLSINLSYSDDTVMMDCRCPHLIKIYDDSKLSKNEEMINDVVSLRSSSSESSYIWYQCKETMKGFKFLR